MDTSDPLPLTEQENPRTRDISTRSTLEIVGLINDEDATVSLAVRQSLESVASAVDAIVARLAAQGRLFYVGSGTSGRIGVLDASECSPTFGVSPDLVQGVIAGGYDACHQAVEASEDDRAAGGRDLAARGLTARDAVVGIAASGRTPYTIGALEHARQLGAFTAAVTSVPGSAITAVVDIAIVVAVGPEVVTGSTRMKAGTAQKLVLNMLSTAAMIKLGYVTGNRMTNMRARNAKLHERSLRILMAETGLDEAAAAIALAAAGYDLPTALVMAKTNASRQNAEAALAASRGVIDTAVATIHGR